MEYSLLKLVRSYVKEIFVKYLMGKIKCLYRLFKSFKGKKNLRNVVILMKINGLRKRYLRGSYVGRWELYMIVMYRFFLLVCYL